MNDYEQKQSTLIIYQPLQPYKLYMSHAYVVTRHWEVCLVFQLAIQPLFLSNNACGSPDYFWIPWEFEAHSLGIPSCPPAFFFCHGTQHVGSSFPDQVLNPHALHWKRGVSTAGLPGKSQVLVFLMSKLSPRTINGLSRHIQEEPR